MLTYTLKQVFSAAIFLLIAAAIVFFVFPTTSNQSAGFDLETLNRFGGWLAGFVSGDFGQSVHGGDVGSLVAKRATPTLALIGLTSVVTVFVAALAGVFSSGTKGMHGSHRTSWVTLVALSLPVLVSSVFLFVFLALNLNFFPAIGYQPLSNGVSAFLYSLTLPVMAFAIVLVPPLVRMAACRVPPLRAFALALTVNLFAVVVIERVFSIRGLGNLTLRAFESRDFAVAQAIILIFATAIILIRLVFNAGPGKIDAESGLKIHVSNAHGDQAGTPISQPGSKKTLVGGVLLVAFAALGFVAPLVIGASPATAYLGTDSFGRDVLIRLIEATQFTLKVGFTVALASVIVGTIVGLIAGTIRWVDAIIVSIMDAISAIPSILLIVMLVLHAGASFTTIFAAIALTQVPRVAHLVRSMVKLGQQGHQVRTRQSSNIIRSIAVLGLFVCGSAITLETLLHFLGFGLAPDVPNFGTMMAETIRQGPTGLSTLLLPGILLFAIVLAFNTLADGLHEKNKAETV